MFAVVLALAGAGAVRGDVWEQVHVRVVTIHYTTHNGLHRAAYVVLPDWYGPGNNPPIPLIISPHGRGVSAEENVDRWGDLPSIGSFAVVNPEGQGRRFARFSWGYAGQIDDLARMPRILRATIPWLRIEPRRVYAFGTSMGGQETLLLVARHPKLLAGAAAFASAAKLPALGSRAQGGAATQGDALRAKPPRSSTEGSVPAAA